MEIINKKDYAKLTRTQKEQFELICKKIAKDCGCKGNDSVYRYATAWIRTITAELYITSTASIATQTGRE